MSAWQSWLESTGWSCGRTGRASQKLLLHPVLPTAPAKGKKRSGKDGHYALDKTSGTEKTLTGEKDNIKSNWNICRDARSFHRIFEAGKCLQDHLVLRFMAFSAEWRGKFRGSLLVGLLSLPWPLICSLPSFWRRIELYNWKKCFLTR